MTTTLSLEEEPERAERERAASEIGDVYRRNGEIHDRFRHVFDSPNSAFGWRRFHNLLMSAAKGRAVLDVGCGDGQLGRALVRSGAARVHGIDVSESVVRAAQARALGDGRLTYEAVDALRFEGGRFDVIVGSAILHHLDWRTLLQRLYFHALKPGGQLMFYEPLGENCALRLYWSLFPKAHTPDERPFYRDDLRWLGDTFPSFQFHATNYLSLYAGLLSSLLCAKADNPLMHAADWADRRLEHVRVLKPAFRYGLLVIRRPLL